MLSFLNKLLDGVLGLAARFLPQSPFAGDALPDLWDFEMVDNLLGWLNWLVPVGACLNIVVATIAAGLAFAAWKFWKRLFFAPADFIKEAWR